MNFPRWLSRVLHLAGTEAAGTVGLLLLGDSDDVDLEVVEAEGLEEVLGVGVDIELAGLGLGDIQSGDLRDVLVLALTLLLLELEGDTADGATLDTLHQVGGVTSDLWREDESEIRVLEYCAILYVIRTLLRRRLEAMMAISSQMRLLVSKSRVNLG